MVSNNHQGSGISDFESFILKFKFQRRNLDYCLYFKEISGDIVYLVLYMDDMLIISQSIDQIEVLKQQIMMEFEMKDLGLAKKILGIQLIKEENSR